jgi:hypothetical protein
LTNHYGSLNDVDKIQGELTKLPSSDSDKKNQANFAHCRHQKIKSPPPFSKIPQLFSFKKSIKIPVQNYI